MWKNLYKVSYIHFLKLNRDAKWYQSHLQICKPFTLAQAKISAKLSDCYVLIPHLNIPAEKHFQQVSGDSIEELLEKLSLEDKHDEKDEDIKEDENSEEEEEDVDEEEELQRKQPRNLILKDKAMKSSLSDMLKTKII
jgi:hypothetical protein